MKKIIIASIAALGLAFGAPLAASADEEKLAICHSGSGTNWTFITPDASGYNGHQHHDADVYGLTEAECLAKNVIKEGPVDDPPVVVDETPFILIAWPMASWIDSTTPSWPQGVAAGLAAPFTVDLATRNLAALDATLAALVVPCETSVQFQVDGNFDTPPVRDTIAGGSLYGPNDPAEALWGGGWDEAYKLVKVDGPVCPPTPPVLPEPKVTVFEGEWDGAEPTCDVEDTEADESLVTQERAVVTTRIPWIAILVAGVYEIVEDTEHAEVISTIIETRQVAYEGEPCPVVVVEEPPVETPPTSTPIPTTPTGLAETGLNSAESWVLMGGIATIILGGMLALVSVSRKRS